MGTDSKFWKIFTQVSSFIIVMGFLKLVVYYKAFSIPAQYFISVSELGMLVSDNLLYIGFVVCFSFLFVEITSHNIETDFKVKLEVAQDEETRNKLLKLKNSPNKLQTYFRKYSLIFLALIGLLIPFILDLLYPSYENKTAFFSMFFISGFLLLIQFNIDFLLLYFSDTFYLYFICGLMMLISGIGLITASEINQVKNGKYKGTILITEKKDIPTNDTLIFVGKSENYYFLYNLKRKYAEVIPISEVKGIKIVQK